MQKRLRRFGCGCVAAVLMTAALFSSGCDPTTQATVENGVISVSQSLLTSFLQAIIGLQQSTTTTGTNTTT